MLGPLKFRVRFHDLGIGVRLFVFAIFVVILDFSRMPHFPGSLFGFSIQLPLRFWLCAE
jgi:hypothetical protein